MDFLASLFGGTSLGTGLFGSPGAGTLFNDLPIPGMPATGGLLRAGTDDMMPAPGMSPPGAGILDRAGGEGLGLSRSVGGLLGDSANTPAPGAATVGGTTPPAEGGFVIPGSGQVIRPGGPGDRTPISIPNSVGGPDARGEPGGVGGGARAPVPGTLPPAAVPGSTTTPPATPGATTPKEEQPTAFQKFASSLSKVKAPGQPGALKPASIGSPGQPHIPQGAQALMDAIMSAHAKGMMRPGPVPELPPGLLQRFR